jgi:hypothetical protein
MNFTLNDLVIKMAKVLCWEERSNGRYCKNYKLKGKNKCKNHYVSEVSMHQFLLFIMISYLTFISVLYYEDNSETIDNYMYSMKAFILEHVKESIRLCFTRSLKY